MFKVEEIYRGSRLLESTHPGSCLDGAKKVTGNWCHPVLKVWCNVLHLHCHCNEWAPSCAKSHFAGHVVIQLCYSIRLLQALLENSNPSSFEWKNSKLRCTILHLPLDQRIKTSASPMGLAKSRLSEERFHGVHTFHGHVLCEEDLEVMEI